MSRNYLNKGLTPQVREYLFIYEVIPSCGWSSSIEKVFFSRVYVPKLGRKNWPIVD